jgi:hypothetical protein
MLLPQLDCIRCGFQYRRKQLDSILRSDVNELWIQRTLQQRACLQLLQVLLEDVRSKVIELFPVGLAGG